MAHTKKTTAGNVNNGTANTFSYSGSFDVFKASEVEVELDNVKLTFTTSTINESASPREYTVDYDNKTVHIGGADLASTNSVVIQPVTDMGSPTPRATYSPGSSVTSADLNNNQLQLMRKALEYDEQKLSSRGGTMTGNLHFGKNVDLSFEGDTDNAYETTITVADPTADRTITFPDTTGTVVTTGDTATVTATMLAANSVDSSELVDGSIDTSHIADSQVTAAKLGSSAVTTVKIATDAVTGAKIADDQIDSEHYVDGSIDTAHIADSQITSAKIADGTIVAGDLASDAVTTVKITDLNVTTAKIADDAITDAKLADHASNNANRAVDSNHIKTNAVTTEKITDLNVTTAKIAADAITNAKIADDSIDSEHYVDGSIDTAHIAGAQVTDVKLASNSVTTSKITDGNVTTDKLAADSVTIAKIGCEQTTISNSDSHIPTSGAVVDYVAAQIAPIGGLEVIADEDNFPTSQPSSGVVISISDAAGIVVNGSGVSTTARTAGNGSDNVTINNFPSSLYGETLASGVGLMVSSTGSSQTYNYHKILAAETDVKQLSDDINDFNARYRVNAGEPGSSNDTGDLVFDTNASKMKVYDGSSWGEVTSTGDFKYLFLCPAGGSGAPTLNGSIATYDLRESSNSGSAASVSSAAQLIVSINGVIQKANTGTSAPAEGFALVDANTIIFGANLASGDSVFIVQIGSAVSIPTPGDGTVSAAKIASGAVEQAKIADQAVNEAKLQVSNSPTNGYFLSAQSGNTGGLTWAQVTTDLVGDTSPQLGGALESNGNDIQFADSDKAKFGNSSDLQIYHDGSESVIHDNGTGGLILRSNAFRVNNAANDENMIVVNENGAVELYYDNAKKAETVTGGFTVTGTCTATAFSGDGSNLTGVGSDLVNDTSPQLGGDLDTNSHHIHVDDGHAVRFGDSNDLQIYHDGSDSLITNATGHLRIKGSGTVDKHIYLQPDDGDNGIIVLNDAEVQLFYNNTKKFLTTSTGARVENTTSPLTSANSSGNDLVITADGAMGMTLHTTSTTSNCGILFADGTSGTDLYTGSIIYRHQHDQLRFSVDGGTLAQQINSDLTVSFFNTIYASSFNTGSDLNLKSNLVRFTNTLDKLKEITGYTFDIKVGEAKDKTIASAGIIAQDVEKVFPELVSTETGSDYKTVQYNGLIGVLVEAVKELTTKVETLETKVAALEAA